MELDLTKPDTGRIIDYWLGGSHNFDVDRVAADRLEAFTPSARRWVRGQRNYLKIAVERMSAAGITKFIVAGSGLPTCDNVHQVCNGAAVLYTDINPVTIAYGRHIIGDNPKVRYIHHNAASLHTLDADLLDEFFGASGPYGIVYIGIAHFFPDSVLEATLRQMHDWAPAGSRLGGTFVATDAPKYAGEVVKVYEQMGARLYPRSEEQVRAVLGPWEPDEAGIAGIPIEHDAVAQGGIVPNFINGCVCHKST